MSDELDGDPEKAIIQCFERSGDLSLLYLQECDKLRQNLPTYQAYLEGGQVSTLSITVTLSFPQLAINSYALKPNFLSYSTSSFRYGIFRSLSDPNWPKFGGARFGFCFAPRSPFAFERR